MIEEKRAQDVIHHVLAAAKKAGADEAEVHLGSTREGLTRFASNEIHQNVESDTSDVSLRLVFGKRTARTSTSRTDEPGLDALVERTAEVARLAPEDPTLLPIVGTADAGSLAERPSAVDEPTSSFTPEQRAERVKRATDAVAKAGFTAAGYLSTSRGFGALGNSSGLLRHFERTTASFSISVQAPDSSGYQEAWSPSTGSIDTDALTARAIEKARASANPGEIEPGGYEVILEPAAGRELTAFLEWGGFSGRAYEEGDTWSAGLLGKKVFGENVTIRDDFSDARNPGAAYDGEGLARQKLLLVEKGVLAGLAWDRKSARKAGTVPTGHGYRVPNLWGGGPENVVFDGGKTSLEEMIRSTKRGVLVTRFWYNRLVDPKKVIVTGMTRDGTFLIEDGKIARGIKNMRFNQGVIAMLNNVAALGPVDPSFMVPAMKVSDFQFSSKTRF
jgi:predicted Zn-dependent protease